MNNNNLNWSDNRVVGNAGTMQKKPYQNAPSMRPYQESTTAPPDMPSQEMGMGQAQPQPTSYQDMMSAQQGAQVQNTQTRSDTYAPNTFYNEPGPPSVMDPGYVPGYLKTQIGKKIRAEFVFDNLFLDKTGILREVGYNYFIIEDFATGAMVMCDLYSARFITSI